MVSADWPPASLLSISKTVAPSAVGSPLPPVRLLRLRVFQQWQWRRTGHFWSRSGQRSNWWRIPACHWGLALRAQASGWVGIGATVGNGDFVFRSPGSPLTILVTTNFDLAGLGIDAVFGNFCDLDRPVGPLDTATSAWSHRLRRRYGPVWEPCSVRRINTVLRSSNLTAGVPGRSHRLSLSTSGTCRSHPCPRSPQ